AQIQAHALLGLTDGVAWRRFADGWSWLLAAVLAAAALVGLPRLDEGRALAALGAALVALAALDVTLCAPRTGLFGAARPAAALLLGAAAAGLAERRALRRGLADLGRDLRLGGRADERAAGGDDAFWVKVAELARLYLDCRSSIVAELPPGRWHLSLR